MPTIVDELRKSPNTKWLIHGKTLTEMNTPDNIEREIARGTQQKVGFKCSASQLAQLLIDNRINTSDWRIDEHAIYGRTARHMIVEASSCGKLTEQEMSKLVVKSATKMMRETGAAVVTATQQTASVPAKKSPKQVLIHLASPTQEKASACDNGPFAVLTRTLTKDIHAVNCKNCLKLKLAKHLLECVGIAKAMDAADLEREGDLNIGSHRITLTADAPTVS